LNAGGVDHVLAEDETEVSLMPETIDAEIEVHLGLAEGIEVKM